MARKYAIRNQEEFYFVTFTVIDWIDVFIREEYRNIFLESLRYCQKEKGLLVGAGFVENPTDWLCSSARDYEDKQ